MTDPVSEDLESKLSALVDDADFGLVNERLFRFNLFEAVGAVRGELRHSNFLAYLLSPNRPHGLGSEPLRRVLRAILERIPSALRPIMTLELLVGDLDDAVAYRERDNIDVLIELKSLKLVVVIENKVDAKLGSGQLARYKRVVESRYPGYRRLLVLLTPHGVMPDHPDYVSFDYSTLSRALAGLYDNDQRSDRSEGLLAVRHYVEMLRRHIVQDNSLRDLAVRLYERHSEAFDFIFDARPAPRVLLDVVRECVVGCQGLKLDSQGANLIRFVPDEWDEKLTASVCDKAKWSKSGRGLLFESKTFANSPGRVNLSLLIGPCDAAFRAHLHAVALQRQPLFTGIVKPMGSQSATIYSRDFLTVDQAKGMSFDAKATNVAFGWSDFQGADLGELIRAVVEIHDEFVRGLKPGS